MRFFYVLCAAVFCLAQTGFSNSCPEKLHALIKFSAKVSSEIYTELQKLKPNGSTFLAHQSDFDDYIKESGGGACASATAFNLLQGFRTLNSQPPLDPKTVLLEAFKEVPELLDGRVTNPQMVTLLKHFEKYLPNRKLDISVERGPISVQPESEFSGKLWERFDLDKVRPNSNELKMLVYRVKDSTGKVLGRHFVVLKSREEGNEIVVIDPNNPAKKISWELKEVEDPETKSLQIRLVRPGNVPMRGENTLDSFFTIGLKSGGEETPQILKR